MSSRPETATYENTLNWQETKPIALEYFPTRIASALLAEGVIRKLGWTDTLSFRGIEKFFGVTSFIPGANAQEVGANAADVVAAAANVVAEAVNAGANTATVIVTNVVNTATATAQEAVKASWAWCDYLPCNLWNKTTGFVGSNIEIITNYVYVNKDWMGPLASLVGVAAAVNIVTSRKIKNEYLRNAISLFAGSVAVWIISNHIYGPQVTVNDLADYVLRLGISHAVIQKVAAPVLQKTLSWVHWGLNPLRWNFSYTAPKIGKSKA